MQDSDLLPDSVVEFERDWQDLVTFENKWYYKPDTDAQWIILSTFITHFYYTSPPVWLCLVGSPGSGKTEIGLRPLERFPTVHPVTELSTNSFLSGFGDANGILDKLEEIPIIGASGNSVGTHGIFVFPDFTTTLLSKDQFTRNEIMGQMRRVYDGAYEKKVGNKQKMMEWKGKVTCIAAATPDIEAHWAVYRDMGERWLNLRWRGHDDSYESRKMVSKFAEKQEGREQTIRKGVNDRITRLIENVSEGPTGTVHSEILTASAILLEECRVNVKREFVGRGYQVTELGNKQHSTRTPKSLGLIAKASATLRRDDQVRDIDIQLARRIAIDSIPSKRLAILQTLCTFYPDPITKADLVQASGLAHNTFERVIEDMRHLKLIEVTQSRKNAASVDVDVMEDSGPDEEHWETNPYHFVRVKDGATIRLHRDILPVLHDSGLLSGKKS